MRLIFCTAMAGLFASAAVAQAPAPNMPAPKLSKATTAGTMTTTASNTKAAPKPRTVASLQCSKDADAKNIHGKPRKAFMSQCNKAAAKA